jgi:hypothetical protein
MGAGEMTTLEGARYTRNPTPHDQTNIVERNDCDVVRGDVRQQPQTCVASSRFLTSTR